MQSREPRAEKKAESQNVLEIVVVFAEGVVHFDRDVFESDESVMGGTRKGVE